MMTKKIVSFKDLEERLIDKKVWMENIRSFLQDHIMSKFKKNSEKSLDKMLICKEDKEVITKTKMTLITELFKYFLVLDDETFIAHIKFLEKDSDLRLAEFGL